MNRLGMLVDLSHVHSGDDATMRWRKRRAGDLSHSAAKALQDSRATSRRCLTRLKGNGGVIMVYFAETSVSRPPMTASRARRRGGAAQVRLPRRPELVTKGNGRLGCGKPARQIDDFRCRRPYRPCAETRRYRRHRHRLRLRNGLPSYPVGLGQPPTTRRCSPSSCGAATPRPILQDRRAAICFRVMRAAEGR